MDFGISSVSLSSTQQDEEEEEESQPALKVFVSQFPIRALPSNDSDFQTSIYIHDDQSFQLTSSCSFSSSSSNQSDGFLSGDEIETTFVVVDPNEVGFSDSLPAKILMSPKARLSSVEDEGFVSDVEEDVRVSTTVGGLWEFDNFLGGIPKLRVLSSDVEETYEDGVPGIDFMGNCKINDEVISEEELLVIQNIPILDSLVVEDANVISEEGSSSVVVVGVQEQEVVEVKEEKINESLGVNVDCSNGGDSVLDIHCEDVPVGKDMMVLLIDQLDVKPVVKELVDSNSGCMNVSSMNEGGPFVEVKKMCLPGLDTSQIEENEFYENKATEVLVKSTSMRLGIQSDQELFDVDGCFDLKSVGTCFGEGNSFVDDDIKSVQNLECIITNPAIEILEQADFAIEDEKNCGGFVGSISTHLENNGDSVIVQRDELKHPVCCNTLRHASVQRSILDPKVKHDSEDEVNSDRDNGKELEGSISDEDAEVVKCDDGYENFEEIVRESVQDSGVNHHLGAESSRDQSHKNNRHMAMEFDKVLPNDQNWSAKHGEVAVETTKDKKDFIIHLDSSIAAKHGEDGSTLAGFNIQTIGKQLAYISRSETKFKYMKANKSSAGVSITFLDKNVATGLKVENQISFGKKLVLVGSTGAVPSRGDVVYGANLEAWLKENDYPIGQDQSTLQLSLVKGKGGLEFRTNLQYQFSVGRSSKIAVGLGLNKHSSQITIRTTSSDQLQIALVGVLSIAITIFRSIWPGNGVASVRRGLSPALMLKGERITGDKKPKVL